MSSKKRTLDELKEDHPDVAEASNANKKQKVANDEDNENDTHTTAIPLEETSDDMILALDGGADLSALDKYNHILLMMIQDAQDAQDAQYAQDMDMENKEQSAGERNELKQDLDTQECDCMIELTTSQAKMSGYLKKQKVLYDIIKSDFKPHLTQVKQGLDLYSASQNEACFPNSVINLIAFFCLPVAKIELNIKPSIMCKIVQFLVYHENNPMQQIEKPLRSSNMNEVVSEWDAQFIDLDQKTVFDIISAANELEIQPILDLTCAKIASMIKGKSVKEIRQTFNIVNDFSPEEEAAIMAENRWADDG